MANLVQSEPKYKLITLQENDWKQIYEVKKYQWDAKSENKRWREGDMGKRS